MIPPDVPPASAWSLDLSEPAARTLIGPKADRYLSRWAGLGIRGPALGFHWPAFFVGPFWMLYRRMYRTTALYVGALMLLGGVEWFGASLLGLGDTPRDLDRALNVAVAVTTGMFGHYWYYLDIRQRYRRLATRGEPGENELLGAGGTSVSAVIVGLGAFLVLAALVIGGNAASPTSAN